MADVTIQSTRKPLENVTRIQQLTTCDRDGPLVRNLKEASPTKSTYYFFRVYVSGSCTHMVAHNCLLNPVPGDLIASSGVHEYQTNVVHINSGSHTYTLKIIAK